MRRIVKVVVDATIVRLARYVAWKLRSHNGLKTTHPIEIAQPLEIAPRKVMTLGEGGLAVVHAGGSVLDEFL